YPLPDRLVDLEISHVIMLNLGCCASKEALTIRRPLASYRDRRKPRPEPPAKEHQGGANHQCHTQPPQKPLWHGGDVFTLSGGSVSRPPGSPPSQRDEPRESC